MNLSEYRLTYQRFQQRYEKKYIPKINRALRNQVKQYIKTQDINSIDSKELYRVLESLYLDTGVNWARRSLTYSEKAGGLLGFSERIVAFIRLHFAVVIQGIIQDITDTTKRLIEKVITEAFQNGDSFDDIVKKISSPEFTINRARLIARTETVSASNVAALSNAKNSGKRLQKIWISARDSRTRPHHREVNQTTIPLHAKFTVGRYQMDAPGDKSAGPEEVCNCRCVIAFIPVK